MPSLSERQREAAQRVAYHRIKFETTLGRLRRLAATRGGCIGGDVQAAADQLAKCELAEFQPAVQALADALYQAAHSSDTAEQRERLLKLANAINAELQEMVHHIERAADQLEVTA